MKTGFFTVEVLHIIALAADLHTAQAIALDAIALQPKARPANIRNAVDVVNKATNKNKLLIACSNFMLAHSSEGLSMDKGSI